MAMASSSCSYNLVSSLPLPLSRSITSLPCLPRTPCRLQHVKHRPFIVSSSSTGDHDPHVKIRVHNLGKKARNGDTILENISFQVKAGEVHGLIGPSGSGKSTVLRAINRMWEPPRASIFVDGQDVTSLDVINLRRRVGMVFQTAYLFPGSIADNVRYGPSLQGKHLTPDEVQRLLLKAGFSDIGSDFLAKPVNELSGGEAQRVALARTLANEPEVLLLDEPTSSLDPMSTRIVEDTLLQLKEQQLTVIIVSHNLEQIGRLIDRASVLSQGTLLETGSFSQLRNSQHGVLTEFFAGTNS